MERNLLVFTNVGGVYVSEPVQMKSSTFIADITVTGDVKIKTSIYSDGPYSYVKDPDGIDLVVPVIVHDELAFLDGKFGLFFIIELSADGSGTVLL
jgi:hypothetical protein